MKEGLACCKGKSPAITRPEKQPNSCVPTDTNTDGTVSPMIVFMQFPKKESSRERKRLRSWKRKNKN